MVTEERHTTASRTPTDDEYDEIVELGARIASLNSEIDATLGRLAFRLPTDDERAEILRAEGELEQLLVKANRFIARFG